MADNLYDFARESLIGGDLALDTDNIKCMLMDTAYTFNAATHRFHNDIVANEVSTSGNLASKSIIDGVFDAADVTFTSVSGSNVGSIVIYQDTGTSSTSVLIAYIDTATGLPLTPNGGNVTVAWNASGIFSIS